MENVVILKESAEAEIVAEVLVAAGNFVVKFEAGKLK